MVYLYKCDKCGHEQEEEHKMKQKNIQKCNGCGADPSFLKKQINTNFVPHVSWSQWKI